MTPIVYLSTMFLLSFFNKTLHCADNARTVQPLNNKMALSTLVDTANVDPTQDTVCFSRNMQAIRLHNSLVPHKERIVTSLAVNPHPVHQKHWPCALCINTALAASQSIKKRSRKPTLPQAEFNSYNFTQRCLYEKHLQDEHAIADLNTEETRSCTPCQKSFNQKKEYNKHIKYHITKK
ncbi:MAG: hypothetical protein WCE21_04515 [Candidatus Babeliales bacterium]